MARRPTFHRVRGDSMTGQGGSDGRTAPYTHWMLNNTFYGLAITTALSTTLLITDRYQWRATGMIFRVANQYPASAAFTVQLLAALFGVIHVAVICKLINYALRIRLSKASVSLDVLRTWVDMSILRVDWDLPLRFFLPVTLMVFLSMVPAALWAGSFTPLVSSTPINVQVTVPSYENISFIKEYPMDIGKAGPSFRSQKGLFTYSVGQQLIGPLLSTAAGASSNDSTKLLHAKIDSTQYSYAGRSYGVGSVAGLGDSEAAEYPNAAVYMYQERGYAANVTCIYNQTSNFTLSGPVNEWIYSASGSLPDSVEGPEYSNYIGHDSKAIVAMGVSYSNRSPRRYIAITAGEHYANLNNTQCEIDFTPMSFNVTVDMSNFGITVHPDRFIPDFDPDRQITRTVVRQFELLSNDLTNLYVSLLGEALNSSVAAYGMIRRSPRLSAEEITLGGLTNAITAMADDMLGAYAAAQLMVGSRFSPDTTSQRPARVYVYALQFGQASYIYSIFALNLLLILIVVAEHMRTHGWTELTRFNYLDPRDLVVAASRGGPRLAAAADAMVGADGRKIPTHVWLLSDPDEGNGRLVVGLQRDADGHAKFEVDEGRCEDLVGEGWISYEGVQDVDEEKRRAREAWERRARARVGIWGVKG